MASGRRLHVLSTDRDTNTIVVGPEPALAASRVEAHGRLYLPVERAEVKLRYRSPALPVRVRASNGGFVVELDEPAYAVAPGQVAALYDGEAVVGAGVITTVE